MGEPVIVGVGQYTRRPGAGTAGPDPAGLMAAATRAALADAGLAGRLARIESVDVVNVLSWRYEPDAARALSARLGISPARQAESPVGGEQPVALLDQLAARVAAGEVRLGLIAGAEAQASLNACRRAGIAPPWPDKPASRPTVMATLQAIVHPEAWRHGLRAPVHVYPLFENAFRAWRGQSFDDAQAESAAIWAAMSAVAAGNPHAWRRQARSPGEIAAPAPDNRWICYPYPKLMNALPAVDQAAAVLVASRQAALEWGIPEHAMVAPVAAAGAHEVSDPFGRAHLHGSPAMQVTLDSALARSGATAAGLGALELYSCFPCVPKMARAHLGIDPAAPLTVTGGLSFFGGPGNSYMLHAIAAMTSQLRSAPGRLGLLYGQGEFVTKHHALVLRAGRPAARYVPGTELLTAQSAAAARAPAMDPRPAGLGEIESFTATWNRDGSPDAGIVVGRLAASGHRFIGRTRGDDARSFQLLTSGHGEPVGLPVAVEAHDAANLVTVAPPGSGR